MKGSRLIMKLPPLPDEWMKQGENPEKTMVYWETHIEELTFIQEFIKDILLQDREYLCIVWNRPLQPDYDNGWSRIWIITHLLQDYKDLIINEKQLPQLSINIKDLLIYLDRNHSQRDIGLTEVSLRKLISRTCGDLRKFYVKNGFLL